MTIDKNKVVSLQYELRIDSKEGQMVESVSAEQPAKFLFGAGYLLAEFEDNLKGKAIGDAFDFKIESQNAYGVYQPEQVADIPKEIFQVEGQKQEDFLFIGNFIDMHDKAGNVFKGKVVEIGEAQVKMDFNHPLAGKDLFFSGEVIEIRDASPEEIDHGHVHGEGGVQH